MSNIGLFYGCFDPITTIDIKQAISALKTLKLNQVAFVVSNGDNYDHRIKMIELAIRPYRKLILFTKKKQGVSYIDLELKETGLINDTFICLNKAVAKYCVLNRLYLKDIVQGRLSKKRFLHCESTANLAKEIANHYNIDPNIAYITGLLHDYTKELNKDEQLRLIKVYFPKMLDKSPKIYHQYTAMIKVRQDFQIYDRVILDAIGNHVNGTDQKRLSKIIFCVDKIEDTRGFDNQKLKELCFNDIDQAFIKIKSIQQAYLNGGKE